MAIVNLPYAYIPNFSKDAAVFDGSIYIGVAGSTDPQNNPKETVLIQQNGDRVIAQQPIRTGPGGVPTLNGSPVAMDVEGEYSILIRDREGSQVYFSSNQGGEGNDTTDLRTAAIFLNLTFQDIGTKLVSSTVGSNLDDGEFIFNLVTGVSYQLPNNIPAGSRVVSLSGTTLITNNGQFTVTPVVSVSDLRTAAQVLGLTFQDIGTVLASSTVGTTLDNARYIFNAITGEVWRIPTTLPSGTTLTSLNGRTLVTNNGTFTLDISSEEPFNLLDNGQGIIRQYPQAATLTTSYLIGADRWAAKGSGTVSAGTLTAADTTNIGKSRSSHKINGVTLTGGGSLQFATRIAGDEARVINEKSAFFSCLAWHDVGQNVNYTVTISRADAKDNFSSVTNIATNNISVPSGTATELTLSIPVIGDISNGLQVEINIATGDITTRNFEFTDLQLIDTFINKPFLPKTNERANCQKYYYSQLNNVDFSVPTNLGALANNALRTNVANPVEMRATPVVTILTQTATDRASGNLTVNATPIVIDLRGSIAAGSGTALWSNVTWTASAELF